MSINLSFSQDWEYLGYNSNFLLGHTYRFSFQNEDDITEYNTLFINNCGKTKLFLNIKDKSGRTLIANIRITNEAGEEETFYSDIEGNLKIELKEGSYDLEVSDVMSDDFKTNFTLINNECLQFNIQLGRGPEIDPFIIMSKKVLSDKQIIKIINCVKKHRNQIDFNLSKCSKKGRYSLLMEI